MKRRRKPRRYTETMNTTYPLATVGELIGEPGRAAILVALLGGGARTAGDLAFTANISAQSASAHLSKLLDGGLLTVRRSGRHRCYSLAGAEVAHALEALAGIASKPQPAASRPAADQELCLARTCYDHLAGRIAVDLAGRLETDHLIRRAGESEYELGQRGRDWFAQLGIDVPALRSSRRSFARRCLDWTERRPHIAGALGAALCARLIALRWIARRRNTRALRVTHEGTKELWRRFAITAP